MDIRNRTLVLSALLSLITTSPAYAELIISTADSYTNSDVLENTDLILNYGEFRNTATVQNQDGSEFVNYGLVFNFDSMLFDRGSALLNYGDFDNFGNVSASSINNYLNGVFENQSIISLREGFDNVTGQFVAAELNNSGVFDNNGTLDVNSNWGFNLTNSNIFNNNGLVYTNGPTQITNSGVFNNLGIFDSAPDASLSINNSGEFVNDANLHLGNNWSDEPAGSIINTNRFINHAEIRGGNAINNSGYFENTGNILEVNTFQNSGDVINFGHILVLTEIVNLASSTFNNIYGSTVDTSRLENHGVFENQSHVSLREGFDDVAGQLVAAELNNSGVFNNNGTLDANFSNAGLNLTNSNIFNNNGSIVSNGPTQITNSGVFNNLGVFDSYPGSPLNINNSGEFVNDANLHLGDSWGSEPAGSIINTNRFINHADIQGGNTIQSSGYFENTGNIFDVNTFENSGDVLNFGRISVFTEIVNSMSSTFNNIYGSVVEGGGRLENYGVFENQSHVSLREGFDDVAGQLVAAELNNRGVFNNNGTLDAFSYEGFNLTNSNIFNNNGSIVSNGPTQITNSGVFNNLGVFDSSSGAPLNINNSGEFVNDANLQLGDNWYAGQAGSIINSNRFINHADIQGGDAIQNSGYFENTGNIFDVNAFENSGDVTNFGRISVFTEIVNLATSTFNNIYGSVVEASRLENRGVFENQSGVSLRGGFDNSTGQFVEAELINDGLFNQSDRLSVFSYQGFNITNRGEFNNTGVINVADGPTQITNYGIFNNLGSFNVQGGNSLSIDNYGSFINAASLILGDHYSGDPGQIINRGSFVNHGDILDGELFENSGYLENSGDIAVLTFENSGDVVNAGGIGTFYRINRLANLASGTFTNLLGSGAGAAYIDNRGLFDNQSRVTMYEGHDYAAGQLIPAELNNSGRFNNNGSVHSDSDSGFNLTNSGEFTNTYESSIYSRGDMQITNGGNFVNHGSIDVDYGSLRIDNSGTFTSASYSLVGKGGDIDNTGTFINYSSISGFNNISSSGRFFNEGDVSANTVTISGALEGGGDVSVGNGLFITESGTLSTAGRLGFMDVYGDLFLDGTIEFGVESYFYVDDGMNVFGDVVLGGSSILDVSFLDGRIFDVGSTFDLLLADSITGSFDSFYYDVMLGDGLALEWFILESDGQDLLRLGVVSAVPLPAAFWLFLSGAVGLLSVRRKTSA